MGAMPLYLVIHVLQIQNSNGLSVGQQLRIAFVTGNSMKAREMTTILGEKEQLLQQCNGSNNEKKSLIDLRLVKVDLPEIQEVDTLAIAKNKAIQGAQLAGGPCVVEDTALQFTALGGMPGPYIKWFAQRLGSQGLYNILHAYEDKSATAVCTLAFCPYPHADPVLFTGETKGIIRAPEDPSKGWDAMFVPDGETLSFAEMDIETKNRVSHRGKAVKKWADWLVKNQDELWERQSGKIAIGHKGLDFKTVYVEE